jgi:hypothetical protein
LCAVGHARRTHQRPPTQPEFPAAIAHATFSGAAEEGFKVTAFEPTSRLEVHGNIGRFIATISYLLTPTADGTRLTNVVNLKPSSGVLRLLAPLAVSRVKASVAANLDTLKHSSVKPQMRSYVCSGPE